MNQPDAQLGAYALKANEGWTYRYGIDFVLKASEVRKGSGAAVLEYYTKARRRGCGDVWQQARPACSRCAP